MEWLAVLINILIDGPRCTSVGVCACVIQLNTIELRSGCESSNFQESQFFHFFRLNLLPLEGSRNESLSAV